MPYLRAFAFITTLTAVFVFVVPIQALARRRGWRLQHRIQMGFCRLMCAIIGVRVAARGRLPGASPRFAVSNHVSWTDIIALASLHPFVFLAKREVADWPVLGWLARLQGTVFVTRGARSDIARVNNALAAALRDGRDLVVFAEGTSSDGAQVLPFHAAHFAALRDLREDADPPIDATLAPIAIFYADGAHQVDVGWYGDMTFAPHLWRLMRRGGVDCHIAFGDAVDIGEADRKALATRTHAHVRRLLDEAGFHAARRLSAAPPKNSR